MIHIRKLTLRNWEGYADTTLELGPTQYAIVGENAAGKSSLLKAIAYVLHNGRSDTDSWIRRGEKIGEVDLELSNGYRINRKRIVGSSTNILVTKGHETFAKDQAIERITQLIGLNREDFFATYYFEQRAMAKFILASPTDRMELVSSWIGLGKLDDIGQNVAAEMAAADQELQRVAVARDLARTQIQEVLLAFTEPEKLRTEIEAEESVIEEFKAKELHLRLVMQTRAKLDAETASLERIREQGRQAKAEVDRLEAMNVPEWSPSDEQELERLIGVTHAAETELRAAERLCYRIDKDRFDDEHGEFDGRCPINGRACPVADDINHDKEQAEKNLADIRAKVVNDDEQKRKALAHRKSETELHFKKVVAYKMQVEALRTQARKQVDVVEQLKMADVPYENVTTLIDDTRRELHASMTRRESLKSAFDKWTRAGIEYEKHCKRVAELEEQLSCHRALRIIAGRTGAQRDIAESVLGEIEAGANAILSECGIDLSLQVQWSREGNGVADYCDLCGTPFPSSVRIKTCSRCNAQRGPKIVNRLDVLLSRRSGAMEDLAGIAIQFAASLWLNRQRQSNWSSVLVDEPFGALDPNNRAAFSSHLHGILKLYGEQAFVVSHTPDTQSALPSRIEVSMVNGVSQARVV